MYYRDVLSVLVVWPIPENYHQAPECPDSGLALLINDARTQARSRRHRPLCQLRDTLIPVHVCRDPERDWLPVICFKAASPCAPVVQTFVHSFARSLTRSPFALSAPHGLAASTNNASRNRPEARWSWWTPDLTTTTQHLATLNLSAVGRFSRQADQRDSRSRSTSLTSELNYTTQSTSTWICPGSDAGIRDQAGGASPITTCVWTKENYRCR